MRRIAVVALLLLAACRSAPPAPEDSPYWALPAGSKLTLHRDVTIPAERASLYVQDGEVRPYAKVNPYYPHCRLEVERVGDAPQVVKADTFAIERVIREDIPRLAGVTLAAGSGGRGVRAAGAFILADGTGHWTYATHFQLRSARQPEVRSLVCQHWADPTWETHLTLRQLRRALGGLFTLTLSAKAVGEQPSR